jgi:hypothetical protein
VTDFQHLRIRYGDWLLTFLTALLMLMIFVFAPLQAEGISAFQGFAVAGLLVVIGGALIISANPIALALMCVAFVANVAVFVLRLSPPAWPYNLHLLALAWLIIAITLGTIVARAVFGQGRVTYHRIIGAVLLYLLIAVGFATLFMFVGLSTSDAFKGVSFEDDAALASELFLPKLYDPDVDGLRRYRTRPSTGAKSMQSRSRNWSTFSGHTFGEARDSPIARQIERRLENLSGVGWPAGSAAV